MDFFRKLVALYLNTMPKMSAICQPVSLQQLVESVHFGSEFYNEQNYWTKSLP